MKIRICIVLLLAVLASSCSASAATPSPISLEDIQSTSMAGAFTALAETHAALPIDTQAPPTETASQTLVPSHTPGALLPSSSPEVSATSAPSLTASLTALPTNLPTRTSSPAVPGGDPCNKPLTSWQGPSVRMAIRYEYQPQGKNDRVILSLWVTSDLQECGFIPGLSAGPVGQYSAVAFIDGEKDFKAYGGFRLTEGSWEIIIRNDNIVAKGGCYPNC